MCGKLLKSLTSVIIPPKPKEPLPPAAAAPAAYDPGTAVRIYNGMTPGGSTGQIRLSGKKKRVSKELPGLGL